MTSMSFPFTGVSPMIIPYFRKEGTASSSWFPPKWDEEDLVGNYHIVSAGEPSLAWCTRLLNYGKLFMGRCGMVGTCVASPMAEISLEGAFETRWGRLVQRLGWYLSTVEIHKHSFLKAIPARDGRQFRIWKSFYTVFSQDLFHFCDVLKVNSDLIDNVNLLLIYHPPVRLWRESVRMHAKCEHDLEWQVPWLCVAYVHYSDMGVRSTSK